MINTSQNVEEKDKSPLYNIKKAAISMTPNMTRKRTDILSNLFSGKHFKVVKITHTLLSQL